MAVGCQQPAVVRDPWERQPGRMVDCARRDRRTPDDSHIMTSEWTPLLDGTLADRAMEAVDAIALDPAMRPPLDQDAGDGADPSLAGGAAGRALFYAYLTRAGRIRPTIAADTALELIAGAFAAISGSGMPASLYEGFAGIGWVYAHLAGRLFDAEGDWPLAPIDEAIAAQPDGHAVARRLRPHQRPRRIRRLRARTTGAAVANADPRSRRPSTGRDRGATRGEGDLVHATGAVGGPAADAGASRLLQPRHGARRSGRAGAARPGPCGRCERRRRITRRRGCRGRSAQELPSGGESAYSRTGRRRTAEPSPARLAWCYGDPGVAVALFAAGRGRLARGLGSRMRCGSRSARPVDRSSRAGSRMRDSVTVRPASATSSIACSRRPGTSASPRPRDAGSNRRSRIESQGTGSAASLRWAATVGRERVAGHRVSDRRGGRWPCASRRVHRSSPRGIGRLLVDVG